MKVNKLEDCCGCAACANVCPRNCIVMKESENDGFLYPHFNKSKCIECGLCDRVCPNNGVARVEADKHITFAAFSKNNEERAKCSSGGIFPLLAQYVLEIGGIVIAPAMNCNMELKHSIFESLFDKRMYGSKYIQSMIGNCYSEARKALNNQKIVLFCGTPCQISGLHSYLGRIYDNLYTQDVACHGTISPMIWEIYKSYIEEKKKAKISNISFRSKSSGWRQYSVCIEFDNGEKIIELANDNLLMQTYLSNLSIRPSCRKCKYKRGNETSDITLADFWGVWDLLPEYFDNKGTSLVFINSEKGKYLFDSIKTHIECREIEENIIKKYNKSLYEAAFTNKDVLRFYDDIKRYPFERVVKKYTKATLMEKVIYRMQKYTNYDKCKISLFKK